MPVLESVIPSNPSFQVPCPQEIGTTDFTDETDFQIRRLLPGEDEALTRIRRIRRMKKMIRELPSVRMDTKATGEDEVVGKGLFLRGHGVDAGQCGSREWKDDEGFLKRG